MRSIESLADLSGRVALVAGGTGHLGKAMSEALAEAGATIVTLDLHRSDVDTAVAELQEKYPGKHCGIAIDLSINAEIESVPEVIAGLAGRLDILVNTAALVGSSGLEGWAAPLPEQSITTWEKALQVNLTGGFYLIHQCLGLLGKSKFASVICTGSIYGIAGQKTSLYEGMDYLTPAAYAASKGGIVQLTRYLASVMAPGIRVNCISPGGIERGQDADFIQRYQDMTPMARMGQEEDFKGVTLFLASDLSAYVTGQNIVVDGGWSL
ncbi:MAG: SDR family oxidoreductase [Halioglobus sp.]